MSEAAGQGHKDIIKLPSPAKLKKKRTYYIGNPEEEKYFRLKNGYEEDDVEEMVTEKTKVDAPV